MPTQAGHPRLLLCQQGAELCHGCWRLATGFWCLGVYLPIVPAMSASTRWNLIVGQTTDDALRQFLASRGRARKGELSRFVEEAVQARILELETEQAKRENAGVSSEAIDGAIDEALEWARRA
jgi:hypothetical protein